MVASMVASKAAPDEKLEQLREKARQVRRHIITMVGTAGSGHPGGSLSAADIVTALYFEVMRIDPRQTDWPDSPKVSRTPTRRMGTG